MCLLGSCAESSLFEIMVCRPFGIKPPSKPMPTSNDLRFIYLSWVNYHKWQFIPFSWDISLYKRVTTWGVVINRAFLFAYVCGVGQAFFQRYSAMPTKTKANQWVATMQPLVHDDVIKWNIFRVTGPLRGEFTGHRWIPLAKASDAELCCFLWSAPE